MRRASPYGILSEVNSPNHITMNYLQDWLYRRNAQRAELNQMPVRTFNSAAPGTLGMKDIGAGSNLVSRARSFREARQFADSLAVVNGCLAGRPQDADLLFAKAETLSAWGRHREALNCLLAAEQLGRGGAAFYGCLGVAHSAVGAYADAVASLQRASEAAKSTKPSTR